MKLMQSLILVAGVALATSSYAASVTVTITSTSSPSIEHGTVTLTDTKYGTLIAPNLHDLPPGPHGFHVHENPSCADNGNGAGGHFDPGKRGQHLGPYQAGHLGDLPTLWVDKEGKATTAVVAPRNPSRYPDQARERDRSDADRQRHAAAPNEATQYVATQLISTKGVVQRAPRPHGWSKSAREILNIWIVWGHEGRRDGRPGDEAEQNDSPHSRTT